MLQVGKPSTSRLSTICVHFEPLVYCVALSWYKFLQLLLCYCGIFP
ncbi:hypothetical protein YQE_03032, partial [Dendroctonus ponderosae]